MNSGLIPYEPRFLYDEEGTDFYSYEASSHGILGIIQRNGSGNASYEDEGEREKEREKTKPSAAERKQKLFKEGTPYGS